MLTLRIDDVYDILVVECEGQLDGGEADSELRSKVISHEGVRAVVLDLSSVYAIGEGGLALLAFLQQWASERDIRFTMFNPRVSVRYKLEAASSKSAFEIATLDEVMALTAPPASNIPYFEQAA
jgi:anti-anti-sigma regulatory factor